MGRARLVVCLTAFATAITASSVGHAVTPPPPALSCSYQGAPEFAATFTIRTGEDTLVLHRLGDEIQLASEYTYGTVRGKGKRKRIIWHRVLQPATCNATPTVHNTNTINLVLDSDEGLDLEVSLDGGRLAPGVTPEADGTSEIEIAVTGLEPGQSIHFRGTSGNDWLRFGTRQGAQGVNLNSQDEPVSPDIDATMTLAPALPPASEDWPGAWGIGGPGNDTITTAGGPEFDSPLLGGVILMGGTGDDTLLSSTPRFTGLNGGPGNDIIYGAPKYNLIRAGKGSDTVFGGTGTDIVELGKGRDFVDTGAGKDGVAAFDHTRDVVRCGRDRDGVARDRKDKAPGCERKIKQRVGLEIFSD